MPNYLLMHYSNTTDQTIHEQTQESKKGKRDLSTHCFIHSSMKSISQLSIFQEAAKINQAFNGRNTIFDRS